MRNFFQKETSGLQSIRRKHLEAIKAQQMETLSSLRQVVEDAREVAALQKEVNAQEKEMQTLLAEVAGLKIV